MSNNFCLSDELMIGTPGECCGCTTPAIKEFIKELKTILNMNGELTEMQIDRLAGDALVSGDEQ